MKRQTVLVELDAIIDTRLGIVKQHFPNAALSITQNGEQSPYYNRTTDDLGIIEPMINSTEFRHFYDRRNKETLKHSILSAGLFFVRNLIRQLEQSAIDTPLTDGVELHLNIYPYALDVDDRHMYQLCIESYITNPVDVKLVRIPFEALTTEYIGRNYTFVVFYNFIEWLRSQHDKVSRLKRIPEVTVIAPALYYNQNTIPTDEDLRELAQKKLDPFSAMEIMYAEFFSLVMTDIRTFCALPPMSEGA